MNSSSWDLELVLLLFDIGPFDPEAIQNFPVNMYAKIGVWTTAKQDTKFKTLVNQIIKQTEYLFHIWYSEFYS